MEYYLGILRFFVTIKTKDGEETINTEMKQLVKASDKEKAKEALVEYFNKESNGAVLIEARINDTVIGK